MMLSAPLSASATELSYCDPGAVECDCSPTEATGYDSCAVGDLSDTIPADDPLQLRSVYDIKVTDYDAQTGIVDLSARSAGFEPAVMLVGDTQGHWQDEQELSDFVNLMMYGMIPDPTDELPAYSPCPPFEFKYAVQLSGTLARLDESAGAWANYQTSDPIKAAISDADGRVWVGGQIVWEFVNINDNGCANPSNDEFSGKQCSVMSKEGGSDARTICGEEYEPGVSPHDMATTTMGSFKWDFHQGRIEIIGVPGSLQGIRWLFVNADWVDVDGRYYDSSGNEARLPKDTPGVEDQPEEDNSAPYAGTCGYGEATKNGLAIDATTRAGAGPSTCPSSI